MGGPTVVEIANPCHPEITILQRKMTLFYCETTVIYRNFSLVWRERRGLPVSFLPIKEASAS